MEKLLLDGKWELHYAPEHAGKTTAQAVKEDPAYTHIEANVPGNAELDLYAAGKAPEPFWGTNLYAFRPYEFYEWWYTRTFVAPQALADRGAVLCYGVPEKEEIALLAAHQATMVIFLSTGMLEQLSQRLLAGGYQTDTPAAIVYKATWNDEKVCHCTVATLAQTAKEHNITKTALIIVGNCLGNEYDRSLLYHPSFTHEFRKGTSES